MERDLMEDHRRSPSSWADRDRRHWSRPAREDESMELTEEAVRERLERLREALGQIDTGQVVATPVQRAHLAGSVAALDELIDPGCT